MSSMYKVIKEQIESFYLIRRLSLYELKSANNNNYLGMLWEILNPGIQITIFWFVFGFGIRGGRDVDGVPFFQWMLAGIIVWFFVNPSISQGSKSIYSRIKMISKMSFPMSVIPTYVIFSKLYPHLVLTIISIIILHFTGFPISIYLIQIPYFLFGTVALLLAISLITSTLSTIVRDMQQIVQAILRVMIYLLPVLWVTFSLPEWVQSVMKINPIFYLVEGYRHALLGQGWYITADIPYTFYFWGVVLVLFWIGSALHVKFRKHFIDFL
ncbi:ABC transporter permease [Cytobacillus horneckiae]|uniref:Transport permease protein n=1 Tax=Cytobacillus horneckiae TaxID=549687 RepID=A0A2N0ZBK4_9BACI|nr:ABC transporter permease [Cytobacillus horneckiae]MEC1154223.1 ABC transporter permease [Cytobacillus horneckiae]MED2936232.1 ABC transporter permease [Cytobacillus horneckiae]PKG26869.1 ABC transporter permease [Cytobacillus horneckiae]